MAIHGKRSLTAVMTLLELALLLVIGLGAARVIRTEPLISATEQRGTTADAIGVRVVRLIIPTDVNLSRPSGLRSF
jgi:hypothetical protein